MLDINLKDDKTKFVVLVKYTIYTLGIRLRLNSPVQNDKNYFLHTLILHKDVHLQMKVLQIQHMDFQLNLDLGKGFALGMGAMTFCLGAQTQCFWTWSLMMMNQMNYYWMKMNYLRMNYSRMNLNLHLRSSEVF